MKSRMRVTRKASEEATSDVLNESGVTILLQVDVATYHSLDGIILLEM